MKKNIKIIIGISLVLVLIIASYILFIKPRKDNSTKNIKDSFESNSLIAVKKNGLYGYINDSGKVVIEPTYIGAKDFSEDYAIVEIQTDGKKKNAIIDKTGKVLVTTDDKIIKNTISGYWLVGKKLYDDKIKPVLGDEFVEVNYFGMSTPTYYSYIDKKNKQAGIVNPYGKITYTHNLDDNVYTVFVGVKSNYDYIKENYCTVSLGAKEYALVNCDTGKTIIDYTDKIISASGNNIFITYNENDALVKYYIQNDKIVYTANEGEDISAKNDREFGYIKFSGDTTSYYLYNEKKMVSELPLQQEVDYGSSPWEIYTKTKLTYCENGVGIKKGDKEILPCIWDGVDYLDINLYTYLKSIGKNYILPIKDGKLNIYDLDNKKVVDTLNTKRIDTNANSVIVSYIDSLTSQKVLYNIKTGKSMKLNNSSIYPTFMPNYFYIIDDKSVIYYNNDFKKIYTGELLSRR